MPKKKKADPKDMMVKTFLLTALVALPLGYAVGNVMADSDEDMASSSEVADDGMSHAHDMFMVDAASAPAISNLRVSADAKSGWNVSFDTTNFTFAPENASGAHIDGQGHAHLYVDGKKITRLYSNNYYLGEIADESVQVRVTLNTNDHKDYAVDGEVVAADSTVVQLHSDDTDDHDHGESDKPHSH